MEEEYIIKARELAREIHKGQKRRDGQDYFTHLEAVAERVEKATRIYSWPTYSIVAAAYLHDSLEDHKWVTRKYLESKGVFPETVSMIETVTRGENENYFDFIMRIKNSEIRTIGPLIIKLADLRHNMSNLVEGSLKDKYRFAEYILLSD